MRQNHVIAALVAAIITAASCGENQSPIAPTPVPDPPEPVPVRTMQIIGIPENGLPAGETLQLTAEVTRRDGLTYSATTADWTSSHPEIARITIRGELFGWSAGRTEITATFEELEAKAPLDVTPPQPNETMWREIAFNYHECPGTECGAPPLESRRTQRLADPSPNFAIATETLSGTAITNLHAVLGPGIEQITGKPYRGEIRDGERTSGKDWVTVEGALEEEYGTKGTCARTRIPKGRTAVASLGYSNGCILLGMHRDAGSNTEVILHELGHIMGFYHTSNVQTMMYGGAWQEGHVFTPQERLLTHLAYRHPRGSTYAEIMLSSFGPGQQFRPRPVNPKLVFIVD